VRPSTKHRRGGGTALVRSRKAVDKLIETLTGDEATGARIVANSLESPLRHIAANAGFEGAVKVREVADAKGSVGLNAMTGNSLTSSSGDHRPGQGDSIGAPERRVDCRTPLDHRGHRGRQAEPPLSARYGRWNGRYGGMM